MYAKQKAIELANSFITKSVFDMDNEQLKHEKMFAKKHAIFCVEEIIKALYVTTSHCELDRLSKMEVQDDFEFWEQVKTEIKNLLN